jgi:protocatechuate 3,4-dioxygenase alpha subunit
MNLVPTPSQTAGPFYHLGLTATAAVGCLVGPDTQGERVQLICTVLDGDGMPVNDAMLEIWQANAEGKYTHPENTQQKPLDPAFQGFGRLATDESGMCVFETIQPGRVPGPGGALQAPHINLSVFARGVLKRLATRVYFDGNAANPQDAVLALVPQERRGTLLAHLNLQHPGVWRFDIYLCGEGETVFFDV